MNPQHKSVVLRTIEFINWFSLETIIKCQSYDINKNLMLTGLATGQDTLS